ncbi:nucleoside hydrolase [Propionimicrobium sp. PCR01-08-3]|uniref:nucleoside hydrolase n=1 Tax=Propionimicrobium sp. PCR01-08-3 TaxID=3052086 RepID=UPI00255CCDB3|nr:nucleoside hydrolase [Propionimicrobium sp. PCR01-08-3]WIY83393.1 nucleoside hydrolase [Propionimicrobium sp. PCR01-08-3]
MPQPRIPLFLDCDPGIDDAIALGYLLCQDDVDIAGIAASGGNAPVEQTTRNALGWLQLAGRTDICVHPGADRPLAQDADYALETHGETGAGYARLPLEGLPPSDTDAAHAWAAAARAHPGELIGVLVGPATNLALALDLEPRLPQLIRRLFIMGGAFNYRGNTRPTTEWNVTWDPEAASRVIAAFGQAYIAGDAPYAPVMAPIEATEAVVMTPERLAKIRSRGDLSPNRTPQWSTWLDQLAAALRFYFEFHEWDGHGYLAHIHDPYVLAAAIEWARQAETTGKVGRAGNDRDPFTTIATDELRVSDESIRAVEPDRREVMARGDTTPVPWAETTQAAVDIELTGTLTRGETVADWLGRWNRPANAEIIRRIDAESFLDNLTEALQKGPGGPTQP